METIAATVEPSIGQDAQALLDDIAEYCRRAGLSQSTFGRLAVNDGKFVGRLRDGGRITTATLARVRAYIAQHPAPDGNGTRPLLVASGLRAATTTTPPSTASAAPASTPASNGPEGVTNGVGGERSFRFYDNRQKYLMFVHTCSEKWVVAERVAMEFASLHPRPPALRMFDAGVGDGTVLTRVLRAMHRRFPTMPFYVVGKEISLEDVRLALEKTPDRFFEHPSTVLVMTNLTYAEAPSLVPGSIEAATGLVWHEVALAGSTAAEFEEQITGLQPFLADAWRTRVTKAGNPVYERPAVLVIYREDHRFMLDQVIPKRGNVRADYDLVIASQPFRARASLEFKASRVLAPLAKSLGPGGRLLGIHSHGDDPGLEILQQVWPGENPFIHDRNQLLKATKDALGAAAKHLNFNAYADNRSLFRYDMHTLPNEISQTIGTSTLLAAWNAAIYVGQVEDARLDAVIGDRRYLDATRDVLQRRGGLWFTDESFVISRRRD